LGVQVQWAHELSGLTSARDELNRVCEYMDDFTHGRTGDMAKVADMNLLMGATT
jgi:hypothetical protein